MAMENVELMEECLPKHLHREIAKMKYNKETEEVCEKCECGKSSRHGKKMKQWANGIIIAWPYRPCRPPEVVTPQRKKVRREECIYREKSSVHE